MVSVATVLGAVAVAAHADLPSWMQFVAVGSAVENALYRAMDLPGVKVMFPRPPAEARALVNKIVGKDAAMYALRAHVEEDALDFKAAEKDWKAAVGHAPDAAARLQAEVDLADFYHRRADGVQEIAALEAAAAEPSTTKESFEQAEEQRSWGLFARALSVAQENGLGDEAQVGVERAWAKRYAQEPTAQTWLIATLLRLKRYDEAAKEIAVYRAAFPKDPVTPIEAEALLALDEGSPDATRKALAMFEVAYQPLWDQNLVSTYFALLDATHSRHGMLAEARAKLVANPDDLTAEAKLFDADQQAGRTDEAVAELAAYGAGKKSRHAAWTAEELYTFAVLLERAGQVVQAARYYDALAQAQGTLSGEEKSPEEAGICGLVRLLLRSPEQGIDLGSGNLAMFHDVATVDQGPGFWNGVLSLWLNSASPESELHTEDVKATPYFHREKAAELLRVLDAKYPQAQERAELHAELIRAYIAYGQDDAVKIGGEKFLADFPAAKERMEIALDVADVDAREKDTKAEFAIYDMLLTELAKGLQGMPLTAAGSGASAVKDDAPPPPPEGEGEVDPDAADRNAGEAPVLSPAAAAAKLLQDELGQRPVAPATKQEGENYRTVLERYLGRLTFEGQVPQALTVLRRELDRSPNDPQMYERLAEFLEQNNLAAQTEEVYKQALTKFNGEGFYDKLARFYVRQKRNSDFDALTKTVVNIFAGTPLEEYFANVNGGAGGSWPQESLELNLYAHSRFPHELMFTRNLLLAYERKETRDPVARQALLREHWQDAGDLQAQYFDELSRTGKMDAELAELEKMVSTADTAAANPAAARELAEIDVWQSHFEASEPLLSGLAVQYPADVPIGEEAESVERSLAYFEPARVEKAVAIEKNLVAAEPGNLDRLATIGDIYADSVSTGLNLDASQQLASAAPYWHRMAEVHPGVQDGYLQSATVFWDYFEFDEAMGQIEAARKRFGDATLFGYQAGAIDENKGETSKAIAEYVAAAVNPATTGTDATDRLLQLAKRKQFAAEVDAATARAATENPTLAALELRLGVLSAQKRQGDAGPLVEAAVARAQTLEALAALAEFAQNRSLGKAYVAALQREIAVAVDPVEKIQRQYELAQAEEDQGDVAAAGRVIDGVYAANPRLVGVVRRTVDFDWKQKQQKKAVAVLVDSAKVANAKLALDFTLEAVDKANESGEYAEARELLKPLLAGDPFNAKYLSLEAESYSLAKDDAGVKGVYEGALAGLKTAALSREERRDKMAMARQGLIPALTGLKDYAGATDQHIALMSAFPEDDTIRQAAASYALQHSTEAQLKGFLETTVKASPQDSRFAIDLGRVDVQFEDYAGALAAYSAAIRIRADRPDLYEARVDLEEHQQMFDAACADYERLYQLTYKDPQWMYDEALARARQGKGDLAAKALDVAWIQGKKAGAEDEFHVASQLDQWGLLPQADAYAAQGVKMAGDNFLADQGSGAAEYARLMTEERKAPAAMALMVRLRALKGPGMLSPSVVLQQAEKNGVGSVTDKQWREQMIAQRQMRVESAFRAAVQSMSEVVGERYTPEEKVAYASLLDAQKAGKPANEVVGTWIAAAKAAGLKDREAAWRKEILLGGDVTLAQGQVSAFEQLETERMEFVELAQTLEAYVQKMKPDNRAGALEAAADAWHAAGNRAKEEADLRELAVGQARQQYEQRLFELYLHGDSAALVQLTSGRGEMADDAANFVLAHGTEAMANRAVANRAQIRNAVWGSATEALVGLYYGDTGAAVDANFEAALGDRTIGERLAAKPDQAKVLVGAPWFYYGTRYGYFLTLAKTPAHDAEDFLPAAVEQAPSGEASYLALAQTYADAHRVDAAVVEFKHAMEIDADDPTPDVQMAEALWEAGRKDAALDAWRSALGKLRAMVDTREALDESFWTEFAVVAADCQKDGVGATLKPEMDVVLVAYFKKNNEYRAAELLQSAWTALSQQSEKDAAAWVVALTGEMGEDQSSGLYDLASAAWFPVSQREGLYQREIAMQQAAVAKATTPADVETAEHAVALTRLQLVDWLLQHDRAAEAERELAAIAASERQRPVVQQAEMHVAAKQGKLAALLAGYREDAANAPALGLMSLVANELRNQKDDANSRLLLEFVFARKQQMQQLGATDYLALAEARLDTQDVAGAMELLTRLTLQGDLYENTDSAAELLERTHHEAEAVPLLKKLAVGVPWNAEYRLRLGKAELAAKVGDAGADLKAVAANAQAEYTLRADAAQQLSRDGGASGLGSGELDAVAAVAAPAAAIVDKPYFVFARVRAAEAEGVAGKAAMLKSAVAAAPDEIGDWIRLKIFAAEMDAKQYAAAKTAIGPVMSANAWLRAGGDEEAGEGAEAAGGSVMDGSVNAAVMDESTIESKAEEAAAGSGNVRAEEDADDAEDGTASKSTVGAAPAFSVREALSDNAQKSALLLAVAEADAHLDAPGEEMQELNAAALWMKDAAEKKKVEARVKVIQARMDVEQKNAGRRPVIQPGVEQTVVVRPRLTMAEVSR